MAVFTLAALYLFVLYGDGLSFFKMNGDNICQIAYWNILKNPNLSGSIGVASTKPGQVFVLGLFYQLGFLGGPIFFKIGLCLVMAACVWSIVAVASELGGRVAGILAFILTVWAFELDFLYGESTIYVIPPVLTGLRLYFHHPRWRGVGRLLLVLAIMFRIEAIAVLAAVWLIHLVRREWRELAVFSAWALAAVVLWVGIVYRIQGDFSRLNSGAGAGYLGPQVEKGQLVPSFSTIDFHYIVNHMREDFATYYNVRCLLFLSLVGIGGAIFFRRQVYLCVFATQLIILVNAFFLGGIIELKRFLPLVYAFGCAIGVGTLVRYGELVWRRRNYLDLSVFLLLVALVLAGFEYRYFGAYLGDDTNERDFVPGAEEIVASEKLPPATRLMGDDDLLSYVVVMAPERFAAINSLQHFNVASTQKRQEVLARTDFIWVDRNGYPFYYLYYLPLASWRHDPFREMVQTLLENQTPQANLYGFHFSVVENDYRHLLLKVAS